MALMGKCKGKRSLTTFGRCEDNIKMDIQGKGTKGRGLDTTVSRKGQMAGYY